MPEVGGESPTPSPPGSTQPYVRRQSPCSGMSCHWGRGMACPPPTRLLSHQGRLLGRWLPFAPSKGLQAAGCAQGVPRVVYCQVEACVGGVGCG